MSFYGKLVKTFLVDEEKLPKLEWLNAGEHFIPIYFSDILAAVLLDERLTDEEKQHFQTLAEMFAEHYHLDYHKDFLTMKKAFAPFDLDSEVRFQKEFSEEYLGECRSTFLEKIQDFLTVCNYTEMSKEQMEEILEAPYPGVLSIAVNMKKLEFFKIYYRGIRDETNTVRTLFLLKKTYPTKYFKRVFVLSKYKEEYDSKIMVKIFRDVSVENLKVVVPEVSLLLPLIDKIKVIGSFSGAVGTSLVKVVLLTLKMTAFSLIAVIPIVIAFVLCCIRSVLGFFNSRMKCLKMYSENLYHQSLANNMGAVNVLLEQAEAQEVKEAFLGYFMLYVCAKEKLTEKALDEKVEAWLQDHFGFYIDFEVDDALRKLVEKRLVERIQDQDGEEPYYRVYNLPSALRRLDEIWDNWHMESNTGNPTSDQLA